jgi:hypothetical protein
VPIFLSQIPLLFHNKIFKPTISLIQVGLLFHFIIVTVLLHYNMRVNICLCKPSGGSIYHLVKKMSYELDDYEIGFQFSAGTRDLSFLQSIQTGSGATQPPMQWILETLPSGVKQFGYEADHSFPSSSEFNYA